MFDRHYRHIYAYAARRLGRDLAEDVASETFLVAFDRRAGYDTIRADARPWLYGIASNLIARQGTAESRRYKMLAQLGHGDRVDAHDDAVVGRLDATAVRGRLAAALERLPQSVRDVLLLVAWAGLNQNEAAAAGRLPTQLPAATQKPDRHAPSATRRILEPGAARTEAQPWQPQV